MGKFWKALSYNFDKNKLQYISTIEARNFPFIGVQFHPEKNIFEWATNTVGNIPHNKWVLYKQSITPKGSYLSSNRLEILEPVDFSTKILRFPLWQTFWQIDHHIASVISQE